MNTREEIVQAFEDFQAYRMGTVPAEKVPHRSAADEPSPDSRGWSCPDTPLRTGPPRGTSRVRVTEPDACASVFE